MPNYGSGQPNSGVPSQRPSGGVTPRRTEGPLLDLGDGRIVRHEAGKTVSAGSAKADICIVFDTTTSMSSKIDNLIACMTGFVDELGALALDWRISVVPFGDLTVPGDRVELDWPFVTTVEAAKAQLRQMPRFYGGANVGESSIEAVLGAVGKPWRHGAVRVIVLLTDEPALGEHRADAVSARLKKQEIITFVASPAQPYFMMWATQTGGEWWEIGPNMNTNELLKLLRSLVHDVAATAAEVYAIAGGNYQKYLAITSGKEHRHNR